MLGSEMKVRAISETGLCKHENQDRILARIGEGPHGDFGLFVVADGMGGQTGGGQAAEIAIRICEDWWQRIMPKIIAGDEENTLRRVVLSLEEAAYHMNEAVIFLGSQLGSAPGTTFSALFLYGKSYGYVHLGDSRIYKAGIQLELITCDDTWVARQVRSGAMSASEADNHPRRHILTQCVGSAEYVHVHHGAGSVVQGESFVICSDGFYHHLSGAEIHSLASSKAEMTDRLNQAVNMVYARGAADNLSAIIVSL